MILYGYHKCSTCKAAICFLKKRNVAFILKEISIETPSLSELELMLKHQNGQLKKVFNTSGNLYKQMQLSEKLPSLSLEMALNLLNAHGLLIKRPFLISKELGLLGFKEPIWEVYF